MRGKQDPTVYIKVFKESINHPEDIKIIKNPTRQYRIWMRKYCRFKSEDRNGQKIQCEFVNSRDTNLGKYSAHSINQWYR